MERLLLNLAEGISEYAEVTVIGPKGCSEHLPVEIATTEAPKTLVSFLLVATWLTNRACRRTDFDIVIGGSGLVAPILLWAKVFYKAKTLVYLHGLDLVVDSLIYQCLFTPTIRAVEKVIVNSRNTKKIAISKGISQSKISIIHPGTSIPKQPDTRDLALFRKKHNIAFEKVMVFVGRLTKRKGLSKFIELCLPNILSSLPSSGLLIVGSQAQDSLNRMGEEKQIHHLLNNYDYENKIQFLGQLTDEELATCYAVSDVHIFPLIEVPGDVEGFGMVAIEAAALGTPTVAFNTGGVADAIKPTSGRLVAPGDYNGFTRGVLDMIHQSSADRASCIEHARSFRWEKVNQQFRDVVIGSSLHSEPR